MWIEERTSETYTVLGNNIEMNLRELRFQYLNLIHLVKDVKWRNVFNMVKIFMV